MAKKDLTPTQVRRGFVTAAATWAVAEQDNPGSADQRSSPLVGSSFLLARSFSLTLPSELGKLSAEIPFSASFHLPTRSNLSDNMLRVQ